MAVLLSWIPVRIQLPIAMLLWGGGAFSTNRMTNNIKTGVGEVREAQRQVSSSSSNCISQISLMNSSSSVCISSFFDGVCVRVCR
mgnify:CR=1 FL=1